MAAFSRRHFLGVSAGALGAVTTFRRFDRMLTLEVAQSLLTPPPEGEEVEEGEEDEDAEDEE